MKREDFAKLPILVQQYLIYIEAIKGHSELSVIEYASDLRTFFRYLMREKTKIGSDVSDEQIDLSPIDIEFIKKITLNDAYQFLIYCKNVRHNNENTRARRVIAIRRFFIYLTDNLGLLEYNPMKNLDIPKTKRALPKYLSLEEAERLLSVIDGPYKERDYAIITFFLNCGLRLSELVSIDYNDIKSHGSLVITGKGNRGLSVHKLRHTAATLMYQHGNVDVLLLKEILGHENLGTTEIYTHISSDAAKKAVEANPLNDLSKAQ